jgi:hypothetical protein
MMWMPWLLAAQTMILPYGGPHTLPSPQQEARTPGG